MPNEYGSIQPHKRQFVLLRRAIRRSPAAPDSTAARPAAPSVPQPRQINIPIGKHRLQVKWTFVANPDARAATPRAAAIRRKFSNTMPAIFRRAAKPERPTRRRARNAHGYPPTRFRHS